VNMHPNLASKAVRTAPKPTYPIRLLMVERMVYRNKKAPWRALVC